MDCVPELAELRRRSQIVKILFNEDQLVEGGTSTPVTVLSLQLCLYLNNDSSDWKNLIFATLKVKEWYPEVLLQVTSQVKKVHELGEN